MRLIKCYIENFGLLREYTCKFDKGLNCFYSLNGTGKTTLTVFLSAMLYGLSDTRKQSLDDNERKKYMPWQGGTYGGSLTIEVGKNRYTIERSFGAKSASDSFRLLNTETGAPSYDYGENIGEELFGIDKEGFLRTVFLSEKTLPPRNENKSISAKLSDLVGSDGDVGGFDSAISLLDGRRKFYYKKSGNCEINSVKAKISALHTELDSLSRKEELLKASESRLAEIKSDISRCEDIRRELNQRLCETNQKREQRLYEERYISMLGSLDRERGRLRAVKEFFSGSIPTAKEVDEARYMKAEGERLKRETESLMSDEYLRLSKIYGGGIDFRMIDGIADECKELERVKDELALIEHERDYESCEMKRLFPATPPKRSDVDSALGLIKQKSPLLPLLSLLLGMIIMALGALGGLFVNTYLYATIGVGALLCPIGLIYTALSKNKRYKRARSFIKNAGGRETADVSSELYRMIADLNRYSLLAETRETRLSKLILNKERLSTDIEEFKNRLGIEPFKDSPIDIEQIKREYTRYYTMSLDEENKASGRLDRQRHADELIRKANAFLTSFKTVSQDPFGEIQEKIAEYNYAILAVHKLEGECEEYARRYNISGELSPLDADSSDTLSADIELTDERLASLRREYTIREQEYNRLAEECERREELEAEIAIQSETLERYSRNLGIIQSTMTLLSEACDNMTSRYIGKTKESFIKYERAIGGAGGEFSVDTAFSVSKSDRGAARSEESFSRGTKDLYALSMRLALIDSLYENESPFIILDDPFIAMDDEKVTRGKALLSSLAKEKQILYFTCSRARAF